MKVWINQWAVGVKGEVKYIFTPRRCGRDEALAIAKAAFGDIEWLQDDEGIRVELSDEQIDGTPRHAPGVAA